jgi:hypothetical protein
MDKLQELVFLAIGKASMCWSETPTGVFNDVEASKIARGLMIAIQEQVNEEIKRDRSMQHLTTPRIIRDANGNEIARMKNVDNRTT